MATLKWKAPTESVAGRPLTQAEIDGLVYTLGYQTLGQADQVYTESAAFPGTLNPDGDYEVDLDTLALPAADLDLALKAQDDKGRFSGWSVETQFYGGDGPNPPTDLRVV